MAKRSGALSSSPSPSRAQSPIMHASALDLALYGSTFLVEASVDQASDRQSVLDANRPVTSMPSLRTPPCPECGSASVWIRSAPDKNDLVSHAYECPRCGFVQTTVEPDPMERAKGWLTTELKPPKT